MSRPFRYSMLIQWSDEDQAYVVSLTDWEGRVFNPVTHGESYAEAATTGLEALEALVGSAERSGEPLPVPKSIVAAASA